MEVVGDKMVIEVDEEEAVAATRAINKHKKSQKRKTSSTLRNTWTRRFVSNSMADEKVSDSWTWLADLLILVGSYWNIERLRSIDEFGPG